MTKLIVNGKTYLGDFMEEYQHAEATCRIYQLNAPAEKYLVLVARGDHAQDFVLTGFDKFSELRRLCQSADAASRSIAESNKVLEKIWQQHFNKRLARVDHERLQRAVSRHYEEEYPLFVFRGLTLEGLVHQMEKELA